MATPTFIGGKWESDEKFRVRNELCMAFRLKDINPAKSTTILVR
jgi:hypothetical protein